MFVAFDVETTGLEPGSRLVEIAAVLFDEQGGIAATFERMVNPGMPMPADTSKVNGITDAMLASKNDAGTVLRDFIDWLSDSATCVAHNAQYDCGVITWEATRHGIEFPQIPVIDTLAIARDLRLSPDNKLQTLVEHHKLQRLGDVHRALSDADCCRQYFCAMGRGAEPKPWHATGFDYTYTDVFAPNLHELPKLVTTGAPLHFSYEDGKGVLTTRSIIPYGWALRHDATMFHGLCALRQERRTFREDRVREVFSQLPSEAA